MRRERSNVFHFLAAILDILDSSDTSLPEIHHLVSGYLLINAINAYLYIFMLIALLLNKYIKFSTTVNDIQLCII